jgi:uncharacterized membrane protein YfcA
MKRPERRPEDMDTYTGVEPAQSDSSAASRRGGLVPAGLVGAGIALIVIVGLIHLIDSPEDFKGGSYQGFLFIANFVGALAAAVGIYRGNRWGWALGVLIAVGSFAGYMISRTVGLPGLPVDEEWLEPLGVLSLIVEVLFMGTFLAIFARPEKEVAQGGGS